MNGEWVEYKDLVVTLQLLLEIAQQILLGAGVKRQPRLVQQQDNPAVAVDFSREYQARNEKNQTNPRERVPRAVFTKCFWSATSAQIFVPALMFSGSPGVLAAHRTPAGDAGFATSISEFCRSDGSPHPVACFSTLASGSGSPIRQVQPGEFDQSHQGIVRWQELALSIRF